MDPKLLNGYGTYAAAALMMLTAVCIWGLHALAPDGVELPSQEWAMGLFFAGLALLPGRRAMQKQIDASKEAAASVDRLTRVMSTPPPPQHRD